ncbi:hypothetical protein [Inhella gelatinilytica]|uniref:Lipoprotein n=1 Tax=Inhella gelatinilytica TaxID=2795030 RepID=A0A931J207_9BURK|nr:hypothetical protein [Inhella gelatinilytica]MBH9554033.1 hypothetical protein [Inhella gelatinilytica]
MRALLVSMVVLIAACASLGSTRELTNEENGAVKSAEKFVVRHGLTAAGHAADLPVENIEVMDQFTDRDQLVKHRRGMVEETAFGIASVAPHVYWVLFNRPGDPKEFKAIRVEGVNAIQLVHSRLLLEKLHWVRVPRV